MAGQQKHHHFFLLVSSIAATPQSGNVTHIINKNDQFLTILYNRVEYWLQSLPVEPPVAIAIGAVTIVICIIIIMFVCCQFVCKNEVKKCPMREKLDLHDIRLFGPDLSELICYGSDLLDYNLDTLVSKLPNEIKLSRVKYSIMYNNDENELTFTIHEATNLPPPRTNNLSVFAKLIILPATKKTFKTKKVNYKRKPVFEETFEIKDVTFANLLSSTIQIKFFDHHLTVPRFVGEVIIPVGELNLSDKTLTQWRVIMPEFKSAGGLFQKSSGLGHICIGLGYSLHCNSITVFIVCCRKLKAMDESGFSDPYVILFLVEDGKKTKKRKTRWKPKNLNPVFDEEFTFIIKDDMMEETSLLFVVADYDKGETGDPIGQCIIGQFGQGLGAKHWEKMRQNPNQPISFWHMLKEVVD